MFPYTQARPAWCRIHKVGRQRRGSRLSDRGDGRFGLSQLSGCGADTGRESQCASRGDGCSSHTSQHKSCFFREGGYPFQTPAALSASDDLTKADALKSVQGGGVLCPNAEQSHGSETLRLLLPHRHSSSRNIGANERLTPRRHGALQQWTPFRHRYLFSKRWRCAKDLGANAMSNSATSRGPRTWTLARRVTSTGNPRGSMSTILPSLLSQSLMPSQDSMPSDLAALSVSDDLTNVDSLKVFRAVVSDVQILNSFMRPLRRLLMLLLPHRHSSSWNIGANERRIPRRHGAFSIGPLFRHLYLSFELLVLC